MTPGEEDKVIYVGPFGYGSESCTFWDEYELKFKDDILKYKITKVKIYYQSEEKENIEEKYIIGLAFTYENFYTGEKKEIEHKGSDLISGFKELIIEPGDYLKKFHINFKDNFEYISQIGFTTYKNKVISIGVKDGLDKTIKENNEERVIVGSFGYLDKRINGIGCLFVKKIDYLKSYLFLFFMMRHLVKNVKYEKFKKEWENKYKELNIAYQFIWRAINLPDAIFAKIIKYCFI